MNWTMKSVLGNKLFQLILTIFLFFPGISPAISDPIPASPNPFRLVNILSKSDFISPSQSNLLEMKLRAFKDSTSNEIVIVVVDHLSGLEPFDYATQLGVKWGVGKKGKDNGVVVLVSLGGNGEQRKEFIAVGYGLGEAIPDLLTKRIRERHLVPNLKRGAYYAALDETTTALMQAAVGAYNERASKKTAKWPIIVFIIILILIIKFGKKGGHTIGPGSYRGGRYWGGGFGGGGFGGGGGGFGGGSFGGGSFGGGGSGGSW